MTYYTNLNSYKDVARLTKQTLWSPVCYQNLDFLLLLHGNGWEFSFHLVPFFAFDPCPPPPPSIITCRAVLMG